MKKLFFALSFLAFGVAASASNSTSIAPSKNNGLLSNKQSVITHAKSDNIIDPCTVSISYSCGTSSGSVSGSGTSCAEAFNNAYANLIFAIVMESDCPC